MVELHLHKFSFEAEAAQLPNSHPAKVKCPICGHVMFVRTNQTPSAAKFACANHICGYVLEFNNSGPYMFDKTSNTYWNN